MKKIISLLIFGLTTTLTYAQAVNFSSGNVPYEIKFADVNFQFSEQAHATLVSEVMALARNKEWRTENLNKFSILQPYVEPILEEVNLPNDFKFLMLYNKYQKNLTTNVVLEGGVLWCLDMLKAEDQGLRIDNIIDERKHVDLSTKAAASLLRKSFGLYDNWGTALYSHLVSKEVIQSLNITNKWISAEVPVNSSKYGSLIQFLAYKYVTELEFNSFSSKDKKILYAYNNKSGKALNTIATELKVDIKDINKYNTWLKAGTPPSEYKILMPVTLAKYNEIKSGIGQKPVNVKKEMDSGFPVLKANQSIAKGNGGIFYNINGLAGVQAEMCDDFVNLSYKGDLNTKLFLKYNDLLKKDPTIVGQVYYLQPKKAKGSIPFHIVRGEESLWDVSQRYGVKLATLALYNRMPGNAKLELGRVVYLQQIRPKDKQIEYIDVPKESEIQGSDKDEISVVEESVVSSNNAPKNRIPQEAESKPSVKPAATKSKKPIVEEDDEALTASSLPNKTTPAKSSASKNTSTKPSSTSSSEPTYSEKVGQNVIFRDGSGKYLVHEVKKGETLYRISKIYSVNLDQLYRLNNLRTNLIDIGDRIIVKKY